MVNSVGSIDTRGIRKTLLNIPNRMHHLRYLIQLSNQESLELSRNFSKTMNVTIVTRDSLDYLLFA